MDPDNVENDPVGELPLPLVTVKEAESSLVTSPDEDVNALDTDVIDPSTLTIEMVAFPLDSDIVVVLELLIVNVCVPPSTDKETIVPT